MQYLKFLISGLLFGMLIVKSEALSWFRIQEMFRFQSFHMFGIFTSAIAVGLLTVTLIKKYQLRTWSGETITLKQKPLRVKAHIIGGLLFGSGWVLTGLCVAPIYALLGTGSVAALLIFAGALGGVFAYGALKEHLPH